ncbi:MAG: hypothetical protein KAJ12_04395 [Bacteroidetes bacterium]|nr:hypothetical protein [Bacteroidota bacterium]
MALSRWILVLTFLIPAPLASQEPPPRFASESQSRLHFFNSSTNLVSGSAFARPGMPQEADDDRKSPALAAVYSLLLPGMGELYAGNYSSGKYFTIADGVLWLTFIAFELHGNALRDDARAYSAARAGVITAGKDDQFFVDVGNFMNIDDYNQKQLRDREPDRLYDPALGYAWNWSSNTDRLLYRDQRVASENMYNNQKFVIAALIVNRVVSAINAARAAVAHNNALEEAMRDVEFSASVMGGVTGPHGIMLSVKKGL